MSHQGGKDVFSFVAIIGVACLYVYIMHMDIWTVSVMMMMKKFELIGAWSMKQQRESSSSQQRGAGGARV